MDKQQLFDKLTRYIQYFVGLNLLETRIFLEMIDIDDKNDLKTNWEQSKTFLELIYEKYTFDRIPEEAYDSVNQIISQLDTLRNINVNDTTNMDALLLCLSRLKKKSNNFVTVMQNSNFKDFDFI
jgi:hypothetical protein